MSDPRDQRNQGFPPHNFPAAVSQAQAPVAPHLDPGLASLLAALLSSPEFVSVVEGIVKKVLAGAGQLVGHQGQAQHHAAMPQDAEASEERAERDSSDEPRSEEGPRHPDDEPQRG